MSKISAKDMVQYSNSTSVKNDKLVNHVEIKDGISVDQKGNIITESGSNVVSPMQDGGTSSNLLNTILHHGIT